MTGRTYEDDRADTRWMRHGNCAGTDPGLFFPERGHEEDARPAKALCAACPVRAECLDYALTNFIKHGIWGGTTVRERRQLRRLQLVGDGAA